MYAASDLRKGRKIEIDGEPWLVTTYEFRKPGKGQSLYRCKLRNMITGSGMDKTFRSNDKIGKPQLDERKMIFSYDDGANAIFMDADTYEEVPVSYELLGKQKYFLIDDAECDVLFFKSRPIEVILQNFVEMVITKSDPGARGDTATNVTKPAFLENGYEIHVPLFVNEGDIVRIDTRTGEYTERVKKS